MVGHDTRDWTTLLPEALNCYNFQPKNRSISLHPAQVDEEDEHNIASQRAQETVDTQEYYTNKHLNQPQS